MYSTEAMEEYAKALKEGQKEYKECIQKGIDPNPEVLDEILGPDATGTYTNVGLVEIPVKRIVGTKTAGRITAFTRSFRPLLDVKSEFGTKWTHLCKAHLSDEGIHDPIECFEYLGNFYVQEGNKRVSVLRYFGAVRISGNVKRIMPVQKDTPRVKAYYEFLEFYKHVGLYDIQFCEPGGYGKLLNAVGVPAEHVWTEEERRRLRIGYYYFVEALDSVGGTGEKPAPEDALLLWLEVNPYSALTEMTTAELKKSIAKLWPNLLAASAHEQEVKTEPPDEKNVLLQIIKSVDHLNVAFIHQYPALTSQWTQAHEAGRDYLEKAMGRTVTTRVYENATTAELAEACIDQAAADGAEVIFTTAPPLISAAMKGSVKYPKIRFFNCSVRQPYASVCTYYSRIYEGKFITGAIAGAMSKNGRIGYVGSYPIWGVPASINAFALGAQLTNPDAKICLKWSCLPGNPTREFLDEGIQVISNRDTPSGSRLLTEYGTYIAGDDGTLTPLASPYWVWGKFYEHVVRNILNGNWEREKMGHVVNLWWGMDSGVIDVMFSRELPEGVGVLARMLKEELRSGKLDPFARRIMDQQGTIRNDGKGTFTPMELLEMDWLCENVEGSFPLYENVLPVSRTMIDCLGIGPSSKEERGL